MKPIAPLAACALFALAASAHAQVPGPGGPPPGNPAYAPAAPDESDAPPDPVAYAQDNLASLRSRLAITPAQAPAWNAFVDAVLNQARDAQAQMASMAAPPATAPERLARMAQMMRRGADSTARVAQAMRALYAQLTPGQRATVDQEFARAPADMQPPPPPPR